MKLASLEISRLKNYFMNNTLIFITYMVGSIACILTFIYFYGNGVAYKVNSVKNDIPYRSYTVSLKSPAIIDSDITERMFIKEGVVISYSRVISAVDISGENIMPKNNTGEYYLEAYYNNNFEIPLKRGDNTFHTDTQVIVPSGLISSNSFSDIIKINDIEMKITGESYLNDTFIVSFEFFTGRYSVEFINILLSKKLPTEENAAFVSELSKIFPDAVISDPSSYYTADTADSATNIAYLCIMFIICFFTFTLLMKYIIEVNNRENIIYIIVGASRRTTAVLIILDNLIVISTSLVCAVTLHKVLYKALFQNINIYDGITYTWYDYAVIAGLIILLSEIPILFIARKYYRQSAVMNNAEYA